MARKILTGKRWVFFIAFVAPIVVFVLFVKAATITQCPTSYTQAQVDATGCVIGANIGAGLLFVLLLISLTPLAVILTSSKKPRK